MLLIRLPFSWKQGLKPELFGVSTPNIPGDVSLSGVEGGFEFRRIPFILRPRLLHSCLDVLGQETSTWRSSISLLHVTKVGSTSTQQCLGECPESGSIPKI